MLDSEAFPHSDVDSQSDSADEELTNRGKTLFPNGMQGMVLQLADGSIQACNADAEELLGFTAQQMQGLTSLNGPWQTIHEDGSPFPGENHPAMVALQTGKPCSNIVMGFYTLNGELIWLNLNSQPLFQANASTPYGVVTTFVKVAPPQPSGPPQADVAAARKQSQEALLRSEERYRTLFESIDEGFCIIEMLFDENNAPVDYRFLEINSSFERHTGLISAAGKTARQLLPNLEVHWFDIYGKVALTGEPTRVEQGSSVMNRWFDVFAFRFGDPSEHKVAVRFEEISDRKQAEASLKQSEERLNLALEGAEMATWDVDLLTEQRIWSPKHFTILGYSPIAMEDITAEMWRSRVHPDDVADIDREVDRARQTQSIFCVEHRIIRADNGETRWLSSFGRFLYNEVGAAIRSVGIFFDISDRKASETEIQRLNQELDRRINELQTILDAVPVGIAIADDPQCKVIRVNGFAQLMLTVPPSANVSATGDRDVVRPFIETRNGNEIPGDELPMQIATTQGVEVRDVEIQMVRADGVTFDWLVNAVPLFDEQNAVRGCVAAIMDVSDLKRIQAALQVANQQEQAAREAAEKANQIKDEFLAVLSHELRTPLNPILGWAKLLQSRKLSEAKTAEALATIERNAKLQSQLIEDLLDVSRILRGKLALTFSPVSLESIILSAIETVRLAAENKNIQIQTVLEIEGAKVSGDAGRLQQVIWNLLSNAVKFTPAGGRVIVGLTQVDRQACITVSDSGKGIDPDFVPYVFEHFRQEDGAITRNFGGLGLGLAIARQLVELHGGTIHADSLGENLGATFTVTLPLLIKTPQLSLENNSDGSYPIKAFPLEGMRILVVDDETDSRDFISFVLEQAGAQVVAVPSATAALEAIQQMPLDLLISDIGMPDMDGYRLMRQIRQLAAAQGGQIVAIALTAYAGDLDRQQVLEAGFQQHLSKPVDPERLVEAIIHQLQINSRTVNQSKIT